MASYSDLNNKVALITGAGSGLGAAAARFLGQQGMKIAAVGRTKDELDQIVRQIEKEGGSARSVVAHIERPGDMQRAVKETIDTWGRLDSVFANAGINGVWAPIEKLKPEEWEETLSINLNGTFYTIKYAVPYLKKQGGAIIITSSVNGTRIFSNTGATAYSTTKAGQVAMAKMLALELAPHKIRVNVICPGAIESEIDDNTTKRDTEKAKIPVEFPEGNIPLTRGSPGTAEQVADLVAFLSSDASSHIAGTEIWIDGAQSLLQG